MVKRAGLKKVGVIRKVGRALKSVLKIALALVLIAALIGVNVILPGNGMITRIANDMLGYRQSWDNSAVPVHESTLDLDYYKSDFTEQNIAAAEQALDEQIAQEGYVLLKNDDNTMPFAVGTSFSFFGANVKTLSVTQSILTQFNPLAGGDDILTAAFESRGLEVNQTLMDFYLNGAGKDYSMGSGSINFGEAEDFRINECPLSELQNAEGVLESTQGDVAVFVMRRVAGEGRDMPRSMYNHADTPEDQAKSYLEPDSTELEILSYLNDNFSDVVLLINTASALQLDWVSQFPHIKAVLFVPSTGTYGTNALADIFCGAVNPSGRTADTFVADALASPAAKSYGDARYIDEEGNLTPYNYVSYQEGIYVGYKYYETRYEDGVLGQGNAGNFEYDSEVIYPFGYGLSYTSFEWSGFSLKWNDKTATATVTVTNTGDVAGKDVVELYAQTPYTEYDQRYGIEKASVQLVGYAKTEVLEPGESQTLSISFDESELKAYDARGAKTYILDAGTYYITAGRNSHDAINNILAAKGKGLSDGMSEDGNAQMVRAYVPAISDTDTTTYATDAYSGAAITNHFDFAEGGLTYLSRSDWEGTFPSYDGQPIEGEISTWGAEINATDSSGSPVSYVWGKVASPELLAQLESTDAGNPSGEAAGVTPTYGADNGLKLIDMRGLDFDDPAWETFLDQLNPEDYEELLGHSGYGTEFIEHLGKPFTIEADTAAGLIYGGTGMMYCSPVVMAQTWNQELATRYGAMIGSEANLGGTTGWYAPSMNIHRTPFTGRNGEYFSEDGFLSGMCASLEIRAAAEKGVYSTIKHFAFNDQENHRGDGGTERSVATWSNEQALREIYLKPFEMCMKADDIEMSYFKSAGEGALVPATRTIRACQAIMSAFNRIGATWTGGSYALLTELAREEWGFDGWIITDSGNSAGDFMDVRQMIRAGGDSKLRSNENSYSFDSADAEEYYYARQAVHHMLYTFANSRVMEGAAPGSVYVNGMQPLQIITLGVNIIGSILLLLLAGTGIRNHFKRKREREESVFAQGGHFS